MNDSSDGTVVLRTTASAALAVSPLRMQTLFASVAS